MKKQTFFAGLADGLPIGLGYLSVSFAFGIFAVANGLSVAEALLVSMTNLTSAGQMAAVPILAGGGGLAELALSQFVINLRYALMSVSLSQKFDGGIRLADRFGIAFFNTDEIFAVGASKPDKLTRGYLYSLAILPYIGWTLGTFLGAIAGNVFPPTVTEALGFAIYGMFLAIVIPAAKRDGHIALAALVAAAISCLFCFLPALSGVQSGFVIILSSVAASLLLAAIDCAGKGGAADV